MTYHRYGTKQQISQQIENLGTNLITVSITGNRNNLITDDEINTLKTKPGIKEIAPSLSQGSSSAGSNDDMVILPLSTAQRLLKTKDVRTFYVEATSKDSVDQAVGYLQLFLNKKYNNDTNSYRIFDQTSLLQTISSATASMTNILSGIAAIFLLVGGIGIMNIMLVSV